MGSRLTGIRAPFLAVILLAVSAGACTGLEVGDLTIAPDAVTSWGTADALPARRDDTPSPSEPRPQADTAVEDLDADEALDVVSDLDVGSGPEPGDPSSLPDVIEPPTEPFDVSEPAPDAVEEVPDAVEEVPDAPEPPAVVCGDGLCEVSETCTSCAADCPLCRPEVGELVITEIMQNPQSVSDAQGEWFEVISVAEVARTLTGISLSDGAADEHLIEDPLTIAPGEVLVFAASVDLGVGGAADYVWSGFYLGNASDIVRLAHGDVVIDAVAYDGGTLWPDPTGAAMSLDVSGMTAALNDDPSHWCEAVVSFGQGDLGSPGEVNLACGEPPPSVCGDGACAEDEACGECELDCGVCPCAPSEITDCFGDCLPLELAGDGVCHAALNCLEQGFDSGDCLGDGCGPSLFFSEYVEGSSNNKAFEIYNPTGVPVDLAEFAIWKITNGGLWADDDVKVTDLEGVIDPGDVYVACHKDLAPIIEGGCDLQSGGNPLNFNGDDALALVHAGVMVDVIGGEGDDPGIGWEIAGTPDATKDHTLIRDPYLTAGDALWSASVMTWTVLETDAFDGLGSHDVAVQCDPSGAPAP